MGKGPEVRWHNWKKTKCLKCREGLREWPMQGEAQVAGPHLHNSRTKEGASAHG